ncbi:MAG: hypothetical protein CMM49_07925 [Rhodospirillaceae bacterium]|nr:hypothetical protein [Rhodospirillaceae bacterium]|tara:strand:+ start:2468 stop:3358 length:891 start_codon:yes stop_codon:yes gene_type:complete
MLLVTGATSHTGKIFLKRLHNESYSRKIRCIVRKNSKVDWLKELNLKIELFQGDLNNIESIAESFNNVDTVFNIAGIHFSLPLIQLGIRKNVEWFICVHTTGIYSKFKSASNEYKNIENSISKFSDLITIIRPTMIYGSEEDKNMWKLINYLDNSYVFPIFGSGKNLFQPIFAKDLANAYYDVLMSKNKVIGRSYNLSGGSEISYNSILRTVSSLLSRKNLYIHIPIWFSLALLFFYKLLNKKSFSVSYEQILRMKENKVYSHSDATKDFDFKPISFNDGIKIEIEEYKRQKSKKN